MNLRFFYTIITSHEVLFKYSLTFWVFVIIQSSLSVEMRLYGVESENFVSSHKNTVFADWLMAVFLICVSGSDGSVSTRRLGSARCWKYGRFYHKLPCFPLH